MSPAHLFGQTVPGEKDGIGLAKPTPQQLAWQDLELGLFIHFDMVTFTGQMKPRSPADVNRYNPTKLDTDQWLEVAKAMGAKYAVFVAKHCTGFLSWQSNAYPYGVKQTSWRDGKADVVKDFIASCKKYDIKPGLYASVSSTAWWGVDNPGVIKWGNRKQEDYNRACETMMTELWASYGPLTEIWFDGGVLPHEKGGPDLVPILKKHQPDAVVFQSPSPGGIRWIGNERGVAKYPCWSTVKRLNDKGAGDPDGKTWNPGECDVPLPGHKWFWRGEAKPGKPSDEKQEKTLASLMDMYYRSVGRNCNLLLNATPDTTGLIPEVILPHYANFGKEIRRRFGTPVAETKGEGETVELALKTPAKIDHVVTMEDIAHGERVRAYEIEGLTPGNTWQKLCDGISIGHKRIQRFDPQEVSKLRFRATQSVATPKIRRLAVFSVG
jgi:alpha-L-fucosidase